MQKMIWTFRESDLPLLVQSTMHLPRDGFEQSEGLEGWEGSGI
jgi:hypothetical protein